VRSDRLTLCSDAAVEWYYYVTIPSKFSVYKRMRDALFLSVSVFGFNFRLFTFLFTFWKQLLYS
jgi:hypothetical protein